MPYEKLLGFRCVFASLSEGVSIRRFVRPPVRPSVHHTRVEFLRNGLNLNKIVSGTWNYDTKKDDSETSARADPQNASADVRTLSNLFFYYLKPNQGGKSHNVIICHLPSRTSIDLKVTFNQTN